MGTEVLEGFKKFFGEGPIATVAALELAAIVILFGLLMRSMNARLEQSAKVLAAAEKLRELTVRLVEAFEDQKAVREQRAKRRALERETVRLELPKDEPPDGGG